MSLKRPYGWKELPSFNARMNHAIHHGCNWNDVDVLYSELQTVLHREASTVVAIYWLRSQKVQFIKGLTDRAVIDITQLECPLLADIILPGVNCTCACHNKSKHALHCGRPIH